MTNDELKTDLFNLVKAKRLEHTIFPDVGSVHITALLTAGLSSSRNFFTSGVDCPWNLKFAAAKWLMHFDKRPGTICSALTIATAVTRGDVNSARYTDMLSAIQMIPNVVVERLMREHALVVADKTLVPTVEYHDISLAHDCAELATAITQDSHLAKLLAKCPPFNPEHDLIPHRHRQDLYTLANPVLRDIHADLLEAYINFYR